jgi:hypothetical protein
VVEHREHTRGRRLIQDLSPTIWEYTYACRTRLSTTQEKQLRAPLTSRNTTVAGSLALSDPARQSLIGHLVHSPAARGKTAHLVMFSISVLLPAFSAPVTTTRGSLKVAWLTWPGAASSVAGRIELMISRKNPKVLLSRCLIIFCPLRGGEDFFLSFLLKSQEAPVWPLGFASTVMLSPPQKTCEERERSGSHRRRITTTMTYDRHAVKGLVKSAAYRYAAFPRFGGETGRTRNGEAILLSEPRRRALISLLGPPKTFREHFKSRSRGPGGFSSGCVELF